MSISSDRAEHNDDIIVLVISALKQSKTIMITLLAMITLSLSVLISDLKWIIHSNLID